MSASDATMLVDVRVDVRIRLSALWVAVMLLFAYGDIFGFFAPGHIEEVIRGEISGIRITQLFLFEISVYIAIASLMVVLSLVVAPRLCRWANLVLAALYAVSIVASAIGEDAYFVFLSILEVALLLVLIRSAWTWPRRSATDQRDVAAVSPER